MNYMLVENNTLSSMKKEHFTYVKSEKEDKPPYVLHNKNITCMITLKPEDLVEPNKNNIGVKTSVYEYKKKVKFVTGSSDGVVKIWNSMKLRPDFDLNVSKYAVTALAWMKGSKKLVVATADRMISFFELNPMKKDPTDRIEDLVAVPLCLEYVKHKHIGLDPKNEGNKPLETLLWGDDLGIITIYHFKKPDWHICSFKNYSKKDKKYLVCHEQEIVKEYEEDLWQHESLKDSKLWKDWFDQIERDLRLHD